MKGSRKTDKHEGIEMTTVTLENAQANLAALIGRLKPGEEIVILQSERPVARLVATSGNERLSRRPGSAIGELIIVEEDDSHLEDFREYMP